MTIFTKNYNEDYFIMTNILDSIDFYSGSDRRRMMTENGVKHPHKNDGGSMLYGLTWRGFLTKEKNRTKIAEGVYCTKITDIEPDLDEVFKEFASIYFPDFEFGQVQMNKNFPCPPHLDSSNVGESMLCTFGDYTGGASCRFIENKIVKQIEREPLIFNGSNILHWVEPFKGIRYSLVFFHNKTSRHYKNNIVLL